MHPCTSLRLQAICYGLLLVLFWATLSSGQNTTVTGRIEFIGSFQPGKTLLKKYLRLKKGQPFRRTGVERSIRSLQTGLVQQGYLFNHIDSVSFRRSVDSSKVDITIFGSSGPQVRIGLIHIQSDSLNADTYRRRFTIRQGSVYREESIQKQLQDLLTVAAERGFPFAAVHVDSLLIRHDKKQTFADLKIALHEGPKVYIRNILISGNNYTHYNVILRELDFGAGDLYVESRVKRSEEILGRMGIFKKVDPPELLKAAADSVDILIRVREGNATTFDGVVGYIPGPAIKSGKGGYFTGLIDLSFKNLFGTARRFTVHWKKSDALSDEFHLSYREPWIFGLPLHVGFGLARTVRDTLFMEWNTQALFRLRFSSSFGLIAKLARKKVYPDSLASRDLRLPRSETVHAEFGLVYDTRDYPLNPRHGIFYRNSYTFGLKRLTGPTYLLKEDSLSRNENLHSLSLDAEGYVNFWKNQVAAVSAHLRQIRGRKLTVSDYYWFGGSRSLRGFRENQFRGSLVAWSNLEYRFLMGKNARIFIFNDWGYYLSSPGQADESQLLTAYGFGIRFDSPLGILGVDFGLARGENFSQGKIHFGLINTF